MAVLKCKSCGGDIEIIQGSNICECEYCGVKQAVPSVRDEEVLNLFDRATALRRKCEFDKAEAVYEKIVERSPEESEAYFGLILCKFGIEYVEDPRTQKRIPTCHRTSYESVTADENYEMALKYADATQRIIYESDAKTIDAIQKRILAISSQEEPYDIFICYKETDENGKRTKDSVIANDIYYQLQNEGYKVFYAAITLEDKLGSEYEPIIFAALNSAKVMLAIGTKPEYFNAVWVKNEWSRFLKMMKNDRSKLLFPCYRDMDAYDLPDEFSHLQGQDMSKIGFVNDIIRGIKKVIVKDEPAPAPSLVKPQASSSSDPQVENLLKRMFMFLEDGDFDSALQYSDKVLDITVECAEAYLGKLMIDLKVKKRDKLQNQKDPFDNNINYKKVLRFGNDNLIAEMRDVTKVIKDRISEGVYRDALAQLDMHSSRSAIQAASLFDSISSYKDATQKAIEARNLAREYQKEENYESALKQFGKNRSEECFAAATAFESLGDYKDAPKKAQEAAEKARRLLANEQEAAEKRSKLKSLESSKTSTANKLNKLNREKNNINNLLNGTAAKEERRRNKKLLKTSRFIRLCFVGIILSIVLGASGNFGFLAGIYLFYIAGLVATVILAKHMDESMPLEGIKYYFTLGICGLILTFKAKRLYKDNCRSDLSKNELRSRLKIVEADILNAQQQLASIERDIASLS